jgi:transposase-like protein
MKKAKHDWSNHVAAIKTQGISTSAYAKRHGLALSTLYYWQRKLQAARADQAKVGSGAATRHPGKFVALHVREPGCEVPRLTTGCALVITGAMRLEMAALPDPQWLAALWRCTQGVH